MYSGYVIVCFLEEVMAAPEQRRHESREEYLFRISSAAEKARILHRQRVAAGEVPPPEGRGPGTHPGYERDFPPPLPPEPEDPSLQGTDPVLDALLWGSALGPLAKTGVQALPRMLRNRRVIRGPSGKPETFYHGTRKQFGELDPKNVQHGHSKGQIWMSNAPETANVYAGAKQPAISRDLPSTPFTGARVYPKRLSSRRVYSGNEPWKAEASGKYDVILVKQRYYGGPEEVHAVVLDKRAFLPPGGLPMPKKPRILPRLLPIAGTQR